MAFGSYLSPITDPSNWTAYISGELYNGNNVFTEDYLRTFSETYEFLGKTEPSDYLNFLNELMEYLPVSTNLCLIMGVEFPFEKNMEYDFSERHVSHQKLNAVIRRFASQNARVQMIDLNDIVRDQQDFTNNLNHFTSRVYFELSLKIQQIITIHTGMKVDSYSKFYLYLDTIISPIKSIAKFILRKDSSLYRLSLKLAKTIGRKKQRQTS